jgi:hypothetical protein
MPGTWTALATQPDFNADVMRLLTDGAVICHELDSSKWHKLTPDPSGSTAPEQAYLRGNWSSIASCPDNRAITSDQGGPALVTRSRSKSHSRHSAVPRASWTSGSRLAARPCTKFLWRRRSRVPGVRFAQRPKPSWGLAASSASWSCEMGCGA